MPFCGWTAAAVEAVAAAVEAVAAAVLLGHLDARKVV